MQAQLGVTDARINKNQPSHRLWQWHKKRSKLETHDHMILLNFDPQLESGPYTDPNNPSALQQ